MTTNTPLERDYAPNICAIFSGQSLIECFYNPEHAERLMRKLDGKCRIVTLVDARRLSAFKECAAVLREISRREDLDAQTYDRIEQALSALDKEQT